MKNHAELAADFNKDEDRVNWHDETLWWVRQKRDKAAHQIDNWELLRETASQIKNNVLSDLSNYLQQFEANAIKNGITVHWAKDAAEHNQIVKEILNRNGIKRMVKSKSMLTEECHLNPYLEQNGIEVIDSDLGERIVQLAEEPPSHIVLPCIHKKKEEIGELFHQHLGIEAGISDPQILTETARLHLREIFITRKAALTGVNFAIAETGEFVVCTNEGNADMGAHLADVHIASMGIEKLVPQRKHLSVFLRLLARSATGQPITTYSSHFKKPRPGQEMHIILVDNGRSTQLGRPDFRNSLKCIRCGACMNTCPVYRRSGGHSYHTAIAGPIGSILAPNLDMKDYADLPFASTLCGSCTNVCPVKIDIHDQLYKWRQVIVKEGYGDHKKGIGMQVMGWTLSSPNLFNTAGKAGRWVIKHAPFAVNNPLNPWYKQRDMPNPPKESFGSWYKNNR
ncbi:lactate utilization protein B [Mucilaginibacter polytrichastri]|uniref:Lactate utilization protein B n=1 Tax=Mucilaginibacter polytrichastri TaxID=1302689 RepID=A0A1Q5ZX36_9SPHI|nr:lactate utilization protein B [Mucilaginibacter polytrichastri]OKS86302.1 Lactate utilization protein B [Mucilaginibacter polytrichastri]SFT16757.1 L-lactate dehydrogenase complex protein LldF [Mucilaginibacter polytrichastri]